MASDLKIKVLGFFTKFKRDPKTGETRAIDYVRFSPAQALNTQITEDRVEALRPPADEDADDDQPNRALKRMYMNAMWSVISPAYEAWKKGYAIPETGTPLAAWAGITKDQADALRKFGLNTVEELASLEDNKLQRVPMPNAREVRNLARKYLSTSEDTKIADRLAELEKQNAMLAERLTAATELLEQATAPKRGPGRPKKDETAEAEAA